MTSKTVTILVASVLLISFGMVHNTFAMGPAPGTCSNQYGAQIINATIIADNQTYYPLKNNVSFQLTNDQSYNVTFTYQTASQNNQGNSDPGTVQIFTDVYGYLFDWCQGTVYSNQNYTFSGSYGFPNDYDPSVNQNISVYWDIANGFSYTVNWIPPTQSTSISAPQNLQATSGNSQVSLSWSATSNNGGSPITNYDVYRGTSSGNEAFFAQIGNVTSYVDTLTNNGQTYFYKVTAVNSIGESSPSNEASAMPSMPVTAPQPPTGLTATTPSSSQINLSWTSPANNGGSAVTGYMIERSTDSGTTWSTIQSNTSSISTSYSDTGLTASTTYTYRVSAINPVGISTPSNTASATTNAIASSGIVLNNIKSTSGTVSASNTITISSFNAGTGSNNLLLVGISANNNDVASVTFGGTPLKNIAYSFYNNVAEFWYLKNPSGTGDVVVTMNGPTRVVVGAYSFSGVNQTVPIPTHVTKHNASPNSPKISITTKYANDWVLDLPSIYGGSTLGKSTCTQQWDANMPNAITGASSSVMVPTPRVVSCGWTASSSDMWDDVAVELRASQ